VRVRPRPYSSTVCGLDTSETPSRRTLVLLVTPIVVLIAVGTVANALTPWLLKNHPLWLVALEARNRNLLAAASRVDVVPFVVFGVVRRMVSDPLFFLLGHLYGDRALRWAERRLGSNDVIVKVTEQGFRRASGAMVFLFPGALVCVLAGVSRMSVRAFFALNFAGTVAAVIVLRLFARVLEGPIDAVLRFNDRNWKWLTILSVALVGAALLLQRARGEGELEAVLDLESDLAEEDDPGPA
jgi:membrane protein DedA with SNARE-associated domain